MKSLNEVSDMIAGAYIDPSRDNICYILTILGEIVDNMRRIEKLAKSANNTASCLANGIQPD